MSDKETDLLDEAMTLAVKKYGFEINDGNKEAVKGIVILCIDSIMNAIEENTGSSPVVSKMTIKRAISELFSAYRI